MAKGSIAMLKHSTEKLLGKYLRLKGVPELCINEPEEIWIERRGTPEGWERVKDKNLTVENLEGWAGLLATFKRQTFEPTKSKCILHGNIPLAAFGGEGRLISEPRFCAIGSALADSGFAVSIRLPAIDFVPEPESYDDGREGPPPKRDKTFAVPEGSKVEVLRWAINTNKRIMFIGGTGVGKTTTINSCMKMLPMNKRLIVYEDVKELIVPQPNCVRLVRTRNSISEEAVPHGAIIDAMMRMRPDRIFVGELSEDSIKTYTSIAKSGHGGTLTSVHGEDVESACQRMVDLYPQGYRTSAYAVSTMFDFGITCEKVEDGSGFTYYLEAVSDVREQLR